MPGGALDPARQVRRNPGFALAIVVTLALGIGLTTAIFSVVNAVLIRPLAYANPDRMVWLATREARSTNEFMNSIDFSRWHAQATLLEHMIAYDFTDATMVVAGEASRARADSPAAGRHDHQHRTACTRRRRALPQPPNPEDTCSWTGSII